MDGEIEWDLGELLNRVDWSAMTPRLVRCAQRHLLSARWTSDGFGQPNGMEVQELIHEAVQRTLEKRRKWNRADMPDLVAFLCNVMRSICGHARADAARAELRANVDPGEDPEMTPPPTPEDEVMHRERAHPLLQGLAEETAGDEDMELFVAAVEFAGSRREDIAEELGWSSDKVSVVKKKIQRRLMKRNSKPRAGGSS
jgi:DNA-directed RNA polymerase specialized sigma24 family protein